MKRLLLLALLVGCTPLSADDQTEYNFLVSSIHDLENPTPENAKVSAIECLDAPKKALRYRKIRKARIGSLVDKYLRLCSAS